MVCSQPLSRLCPAFLDVAARPRRADTQAVWQSGQDATGRTADPTRPAAMRPGSTSRTGCVLLLIRKVQFESCRGRKDAGQRVKPLALLALWQCLTSDGAFRATP
jgi:hypothetical protein